MLAAMRVELARARALEGLRVDEEEEDVLVAKGQHYPPDRLYVQRILAAGKIFFSFFI
jgi:hypothetical protein